MQRRILAGLFLIYLFTVAGGGAQSLASREAGLDDGDT
jgi:hypothetical protein